MSPHILTRHHSRVVAALFTLLLEKVGRCFCLCPVAGLTCVREVPGTGRSHCVTEVPGTGRSHCVREVPGTGRSHCVTEVPGTGRSHCVTEVPGTIQAGPTV